MVLVKRGPEWSATSRRAGGLFTDTSADSSATHKIGSVVLSSSTSPGTDSPDNNTDGTDQDRTTDTHDNTDDDLFLA